MTQHSNPSPLAHVSHKSALLSESADRPHYTNDNAYAAHVKSVYDGDTITVDIDVGFGIVLRDQSLRLLGINAPEMRGGTEETKAAALAAKAFVESRILNKVVLLKVKRDANGCCDVADKYGRWLVWVIYNTGDKKQCLNDEILAAGLAVGYAC